VPPDRFTKFHLVVKISYWQGILIHVSYAFSFVQPAYARNFRLVPIFLVLARRQSLGVVHHKSHRLIGFPTTGPRSRVAFFSTMSGVRLSVPPTAGTRARRVTLSFDRLCPAMTGSMLRLNP
jgi:hypothetical protein